MISVAIIRWAKFASLSLLLIALASAANAQCTSTSNYNYPFTQGCPLPAAGLNAAIAGRMPANAIGATVPAAANNILAGGLTLTILPPQASGTLGLAGTAAVPTFGATAEGDVFLTSANGLNLIGKGSTCDVSLLNDSGIVSVCVQPSGETVFGGTLTSNNALIDINGSLATNNTANQYGLQINPAIGPTGASLGTLRGLGVAPNLNGSAITVTNFWGIDAIPTISSGFTGTVTGITDFVARSPSIASGSVATFDGYFVMPITNGNAITSGTVSNTGLGIGAFTAVPGAGGTINNTGIGIAMPTGTNAGTETAIGLNITGNGPTGGSTNWAIKSTSSADSELTGGLDATPIGATTPSTGAFTTLSVTGAVSCPANTVSLTTFTVTNGIVTHC